MPWLTSQICKEWRNSAWSSSLGRWGSALPGRWQTSRGGSGPRWWLGPSPTRPPPQTGPTTLAQVKIAYCQNWYNTVTCFNNHGQFLSWEGVGLRMSILATKRMALSRDETPFNGQDLVRCLQGVLLEAVATRELEQLTRWKKSESTQNQIRLYIEALM